MRAPAASLQAASTRLMPGRLRCERDGARRARVRLEHVEVAAGDRELHVEQADDAERARDPPHDVTDLEVRRRVERRRRQHAGRVARVHAGLLDVLHHGGDVAERSVGRARRRRSPPRPRGSGRRARVPARRSSRVHLLGRVADAHRAPAEHVRRPHEHRIADPVGDLPPPARGRRPSPTAARGSRARR